MTQFPLEALYSRRYTHSVVFSCYVVFELLAMMLFGFFFFYQTCGAIEIE